MAAIIEVKYFNAFNLRKTVDNSTPPVPVWKGTDGLADNAAKNWIIEESRIRGGYNNTSVDFGAKAYLISETNAGSIKHSGLIYSGIFNSRTSVNNTNQFPVGSDITRTLDPSKGSIQKLYAEDTNLTVFQELKVSKALIDKDAIYSAEGGGITTSGSQVIGQVVPYTGEYGISQDPGSFAKYANRKYFTDRNKNLVLRLSTDGITEISAYGMKDFFRDEMENLNHNSNVRGKVIGGYDSESGNYILSLQEYNGASYKTLSFSERSKGWVSFYNYKPDQLFSLKGKFYSTNSNSADTEKGLQEHHATEDSHNSFYGNAASDSFVTFVFNPKASTPKSFLTMGYEGSNGWKVESFESDATGPESFFGNFINRSDVAKEILSYVEGEYVIEPTSGAVVRPQDYQAAFQTPFPPYTKHRAGFDRKENKYMANLVNNSTGNPGEVSFGNHVSGIKGMFATVKISTDRVTQFGNKKELYAVSSNYTESSY
jgi:hypothetical protein